MEKQQTLLAITAILLGTASGIPFALLLAGLIRESWIKFKAERKKYDESGRKVK